MKKYLLIILALFIFLSCNESITENPNADDVTTLSKKPPRPPKPDPEPTVPLNLSSNVVEIVSANFDVIEIGSYDGAKYNKIWSFRRDNSIFGVDIGDVDNDGEDELVVSVAYSEGKGKKNRKELLDLLIFENGDISEPSRSARVTGEIITCGIVIGDANNDGANEILLGGRNNIRVWEGVGPSEIWSSEDTYYENPWSVQIEDADSDGENEIIYSSLTAGHFVVYDYLGANSWGNRIVSEEVPGAVDIVDFGDIDNDGVIEAVGGGNANVIYVWEYISGNYVLTFTSEHLGGYTQGVEVADFDNDGIDEIAIGTASSTDNGDFYIFEYDGSTYVQTFYEMISGNVNAIKSADVDSDGLPEILIAAVPGKIIYDYSSGYIQVYSSTSVNLVYIQGG